MAAAEPEAYNVLFAEDRDALMAIAQDALVVPRLDRERAQNLTEHVKKEFKPLLPEVDAGFKGERLTAVLGAYERLVRRSNVYYAAELAAETPWNPTQKKRSKELTAINRANDKYLFKWAWDLFEDNPDLLPELISIRAGRGKRDDAEDVVREVRLFRDRWEPDELANNCPVALERIDQAERDATEQLELLKLTEPDKTGSPGDLRKRAYTAWLEDYNLVIQTGRYLRYKEPGVEKRFPGAAPERSPSESVAAPEAPAPTETAPADGA
jgi:hypothetical protein